MVQTVLLYNKAVTSEVLLELTHFVRFCTLEQVYVKSLSVSDRRSGNRHMLPRHR